MLDLTAARAILDAALAHGRAAGYAPLAVAVLDARGALKAFAAEDGTSLRRGEVARGKADGALALGVGSRAIAGMAAARPHFVAAVTHAAGGSLIPVPGGVLVRDAGGGLLGAVGVSGATSDEDEAAAMAGIEAAGLVGETG